jgi:hypothetical protein
MARTRTVRKPSLNAILRAIETSVAEAVESAVPKAMHAEFLKLGLATDGEEKQIDAQKDFAFLRRARRGAESTEKEVGKAAVKWGLGALGAVFLAGIGAFIRGAVHSP